MKDKYELIKYSVQTYLVLFDFCLDYLPITQSYLLSITKTWETSFETAFLSMKNHHYKEDSGHIDTYLFTHSSELRSRSSSRKKLIS